MEGKMEGWKRAYQIIWFDVYKSQMNIMRLDKSTSWDPEALSSWDANTPPKTTLKHRHSPSKKMASQMTRLVFH